MATVSFLIDLRRELNMMFLKGHEQEDLESLDRLHNLVCFFPRERPGQGNCQSLNTFGRCLLGQLRLQMLQDPPNRLHRTILTR